MTILSERLDGRVVVVTGGGSGIGLETCRAAAHRGARVAVVDQDAEVARAVADEVGGRGYQGDVTDKADVAAIADRIAADLGPVDGLVTSAGISTGGSTEDISEELWDRVYAVNVKGTLFWMQAVIPSMKARGAGSIVTISSQLSRAGGRGNAAYISSKGAILSLTYTAALELSETGIRINSVLPGATDTPMFRRSLGRAEDPDAARERSRTRHAMQRFGKPEEIAAAVVFLLSDQAAFMTGVQLPVDGGWLVA